MATKKATSLKAPPNYDYSAPARVARQRKALADAGGARVEANLDAYELEKLDAMVRAKVAGTSRSAVLKYLVRQSPDPKEPGEEPRK